MKVVRFVDSIEFEKYLRGVTIVNHDSHAGLSTTSVGNCFAEITDTRDADKWLRKMFFIRPCLWCIEFDTNDFKNPLNASSGHYSADSIEDIDAGKSIDVREWCTTKYSIHTHPYTRIGICPSLQDLICGKKIEWRINK